MSYLYCYYYYFNCYYYAYYTYAFVIENKYIKTNIQKYFWSDVWRTMEQAETSNLINYP